MNQYLLTPAAGKRLIAKALCEHPFIDDVLKSGTLAIIAGTTNGYVAQEILKKIDQGHEFRPEKFFRGVVLPPKIPVKSSGRLYGDDKFPGDVIINQGEWLQGKTIFDVVDQLKTGDVILKGVNALDYIRRQAAIYIGDPKAGTIGAALQAVVGRRVKLILPVGLEKRVYDDLYQISLKLNETHQKGPRMLPVPGEIFTEIEAIKQLTNCRAQLIASGGVAGAEGSIWLRLEGEDKELLSASNLLKSVQNEERFQI
ncbi:MAG: hypothetical protein ACP5C3_03350 [Methanomicrobiales archaeon]